MISIARPTMTMTDRAMATFCSAVSLGRSVFGGGVLPTGTSGVSSTFEMDSSADAIYFIDKLQIVPSIGRANRLTNFYRRTRSQVNRQTYFKKHDRDHCRRTQGPWCR